jgi:hypothetical protein
VRYPLAEHVPNEYLCCAFSNRWSEYGGMVEPSLMHLAILMTKATNPRAHSVPANCRLSIMWYAQRENKEKEERAIALSSIISTPMIRSKVWAQNSHSHFPHNITSFGQENLLSPIFMRLWGWVHELFNSKSLQFTSCMELIDNIRKLQGNLWFCTVFSLFCLPSERLKKGSLI